MVRKVVIRRMDAIAFGLVMVWIARFYPKIWTNLRWPLLVVGLALFFAIDHYGEPVTSAYAQIWIFSLSSLAYAFWLPFLAGWEKAPEWLTRPIRHISLVSYSLYLVHLGLISEVIQKSKIVFLNSLIKDYLTFQIVYFYRNIFSKN